MTPYSRLAPFVREYIHEQQWESLRDIQEAAIGAVFDHSGNILIASGTASGKTEAALFPVLSLLAENGGGKTPSVQVLYIGPLKALINDQFDRLQDLLGRGTVPLWRWHGDVGAEHKQKLLENPSGILQITPESLEALLIRQRKKIASLFCGLAFIIIDEIHAFMGSDRGSQMLCQISRIEELAGCAPRRIGLSATLGDYREAMDWLALGSDRDTVLIHEGNGKRRISIALDYFDGESPVSPSTNSGAKTDEAAYHGELYEQCRGRKCIIFTNSRLEAEETIAALRVLAAARHEDDIFHVHHGSISGTLREEAERDLKEKEGPAVTAATATLELGIDIGRLDRIIQIGPPLSVGSFVQRLGRSGRRSGKAEIYFTCLEADGEKKRTHTVDADKAHPKDSIDDIPWPLLRTVAVIQLYLEEKWIEPAPRRHYPYSLLCHETMSILAACGEQAPADLARRVLSMPVFSSITQEDYRELLHSLLDWEYLQRTEEGKLIIGLEGERIIAHYSFYAVFPDEEEFRVIQGGRELGTINFLPAAGSTLALTGRYWRVEGFDVRDRTIFVAPAETGGEKLWRGGGADIHPRVALRMKAVLEAETVYPYLTGRAASQLIKARQLSRESGLTASPFVLPHGGGFFLVPWLGTRAMRTLMVLFQNRTIREKLGINALYRKNDHALSIGSALQTEAFSTVFAELLAEMDSLEELLDQDKIPYIDKYDYLLPPRLLAKQYAAHQLDLEGVRGLFGYTNNRTRFSFP
ncbi:ATP-dependent helicase [Spirochaetia bacterium]|nr:ATP-dependent helicase [Spirochaetia bacterium]